MPVTTSLEETLKWGLHDYGDEVPQHCHSDSPLKSEASPVQTQSSCADTSAIQPLLNESAKVLTPSGVPKVLQSF